MARKSSTPSNSLKGNNYNRKKERFVSHARVTPRLTIQANFILRYLTGHRSYGVHKTVSSEWPADERQFDRYIPRTVRFFFCFVFFLFCFFFFFCGVECVCVWGWVAAGGWGSQCKGIIQWCIRSQLSERILSQGTHKLTSLLF